MTDTHTHIFTSSYTADVSGVCSIMYELGGLTVLHDPSGCNSTYTTHDEPRWYDSKSLMFVSGLDELTAVYGDDTVLIRNVKNAAKTLKPKFITLCGASIPHVIGFDFKGTARLIEKETHIPVLPVRTDGLSSYIQGVGMAMREWIMRFAKESSMTQKNCVNVLGVTPLDFTNQEHVNRMLQTLQSLDWTINTCFAMGDSFKNLEYILDASTNLVVSSAGRMAARFMYQKYHRPYTEGIPIGKYMANQIHLKLKEAQDTGISNYAYDENPDCGEILVIGEQIEALSFMTAVNHSSFAKENHLKAYAIWPNAKGGFDEKDFMKRIQSSKYVICDPLYKNCLHGSDTKLFAVPHIAYSGRIFLQKHVYFENKNFDINKFFKGDGK